MNVTLCNLTRFGDLLQSQSVIDALHKAGHNVDLICLRNFASAVPLIRHLRHVLPLNGGRLLAKTDGQWPEAVAELTGFARQAVERCKPDYVINLTPGAPARLLTRLLAGDHAKTLGFGLDNYGFGIDHGIWVSFFSVAAGKRVNSPFNLADMLRMLAAPLLAGHNGDFHLALPDENAIAWAKSYIHSNGNSEATQYVAFQLGASEERRRWPVSCFRQLGQRLWDEMRIQPVLLGSASEKALAQEYAGGALHPFIDAVGFTNIPQLAALLRQTRLLITNDTGTMHLASGMGVTSLALFFATAQPWDTGPMLPGCCCLEPALDCHPCAFGKQCLRGDESCRLDITADSVFRLVSGWLENGAWNGEGIKDARVWATGRDSAGFYEISPLSPVTQNSLWLAWMRVFWRQLFDDIEAEGNNGKDMPAGYASLAIPQDAKAVAKALLEGAALLDAIVECGNALASAPRLGQIFLRNCEKLWQFWRNCARLEPLAAFWNELRKTQGGNVPNFVSQSAKIARQARAMTNALSSVNK